MSSLVRITASESVVLCFFTVFIVFYLHNKKLLLNLRMIIELCID